MALRNVGMLTQHYAASRPRKPQVVVFCVITLPPSSRWRWSSETSVSYLPHHYTWNLCTSELILTLHSPADMLFAPAPLPSAVDITTEQSALISQPVSFPPPRAAVHILTEHTGLANGVLPYLQTT